MGATELCTRASLAVPGGLGVRSGTHSICASVQMVTSDTPRVSGCTAGTKSAKTLATCGFGGGTTIPVIPHKHHMLPYGSNIPHNPTRGSLLPSQPKSSRNQWLLVHASVGPSSI